MASTARPPMGRLIWAVSAAVAAWSQSEAAYVEAPPPRCVRREAAADDGPKGTAKNEHDAEHAAR